jgi:hypothetical protein
MGSAMKNLRFSTVPVLLCAVSMFGLGLGCGESGGTAGSAGTAGSGGTGGAGGSAAPVITEVQWNWADPCKPTTSALTVTVFATDDDTEELSLTYSGSVSDCTPDPFRENFSVVSILDCQPLDSEVRYSGTVTVSDPENNSDTVELGFFHCESDEVCEGGDPCE